MSFHSTTSALSAYGLAGGFGFSQPNWQLVQIVNSPNSNDYSYRFGASVDLSTDANYMVVGNPVYTINGNGAAFVYANSISGFTLEQQLTPNVTLSNGSAFGQNVQLDGNANIAVISAPNYNNQGAIFIFTRSGNIWSHANTIQSSDIANGDSFGSSISINNNGDYIAVGATGEDTTGTTNNGAVYIFTRSGNVWSQQAKLLSNARTTNAFFGSSVALIDSANRVYIGAFGEDNRKGGIYYFTRSGNTWSQTDFGIIGQTNNEGACRSLAINNSGTRAYTIGYDINDFYFYSINGNTLNKLQTINLNVYSNEGGTERAVTCDSTGNIPACVPRVNNFGITFDQPNALANTLQVSQLLYGETGNNQSPGEIAISYDGNTLALGQIDNASPVSDGKVFIYKQS